MKPSKSTFIHDLRRMLVDKVKQAVKCGNTTITCHFALCSSGKQKDSRDLVQREKSQFLQNFESNYQVTC